MVATIPEVTTLSEEDIQKIIEARHSAPHTVLGPHFIEDKGMIVVRAFLPYAKRVQAVRRSIKVSRRKMQPIHPAGLFEAVFPAVTGTSDTFRYQLRITDQEGKTQTGYDPYAFDFSVFSREDNYRFGRGMHYRLFDKLGAHARVHDEITGVNFAVWAPQAERVSVVGNFNRWDGHCHPMRLNPESGVWELFIPGLGEGELYKYEIRARGGGVFHKTDPYAFCMEPFPKTAAVISTPGKQPWRDDEWMQRARRTEIWKLPVSIYRVDETPWQSISAEESSEKRSPPNYRKLADAVIPTVKKQGFTHIELSPPAPPYDKVNGLFAPHAHYGQPEDLMAFVDACHQHGIGVILNWMPSRFPEDTPELIGFDGTPLYEQSDARSGTGQARFAWTKPEVSNFLIANILFWLENYHIDGLRTDAAGSLFILKALDRNYRVLAPLKLLVREYEENPTIAEDDIQKIVQESHSNPAGVLGPHAIEADKTAIRAFLPDAGQLYVLRIGYPKVLYQMIPIHQAGLFETLTAERPAYLNYRLYGIDKKGNPFNRYDPYAFVVSTFGEDDRRHFSRGRHYRIFEKLGAHPLVQDGVAGVNFAVWSPNADRISVIGTFNHWDGRFHQMSRHEESGVWELFIPDLKEGELYKYEIRTREGEVVTKADPYAFFAEASPDNASIVYRPQGKHIWRDDPWLRHRKIISSAERPMAIYEVHLGSWKRKADNDRLSYRELAEELVSYVKQMGFTHIELLPIAEYPYDPSWGYQITNFYAPTSRYGRPEDLMTFVDACHQNGIGVILDWVPAHFPKDPHALAQFDGGYIYEHEDPKRSEHPDWGTLIFDYGKPEVENFLIANALFWLKNYHFDGLRVDAVASMLYLDYSRNYGQWEPNVYGGNENLEAIEFLKHLNTVVSQEEPGVMMVAEESTSWPKVSGPVDQGGLGFGFKWNMGWMHDVLSYMKNDPIYRRYHHKDLTFSLVYAFNERFILSLSHDEVVHLKKSLLDKMPGDETHKFANLRLLYTYMYAHPGKKLLFMGGEFGQWREWNFDKGLDWDLLEKEPHQRLQRFVKDLNRLYRSERAFFEVDFDARGFEWIDAESAGENVIAFLRRAKDPRNCLFFVLNFSAITRENYRIGVPFPVFYRELFNSDAEAYGGGGELLPKGGAVAEEIPWHGHPFSLSLLLPPLGAIVLKPLPPDEEPLPGGQEDKANPWTKKAKPLI